MNVRGFHPGQDDEAVLQLRRRVWGTDHAHSTDEFFHWLFQRNPHGIGGGVMLEDQGMTIGFAGLSKRQMAWGGKEVPVAFAMDYMIDPDHRNGFAASRLASAWTKSLHGTDHQFGMCFPNNNSYRIITGKKLGWKRMFTLTMLARPVGRINALPGKLAVLPKGIVAPAFRAASAICALSNFAMSPRGPQGHISEVTGFDARYDELWASSGVENGTVRSAAYLNWRYAAHPIYAYRIFALTDGNHLSGYMVITQRELFGVTTFLIVDALADPAIPGVIEALVQEVVRQAPVAGAAIVGTQSIRGSHLCSAFMRAGLWPVPGRFSPKEFSLVVHSLGKEFAPRVPASWHLTWGDMDVI